MNPTLKPYLIRALHEWCSDQGHTPYIQVWVNEHTRVPIQFVKDNQIILNIGATACAGLNIDNDWVSFTARFGGVAHDIWIPVGHVISIFSRESGEGMGFEVEPYEADASGNEAQQEPAADKPTDGEPAKSGKVLKFVK